jgi:hypothetical protein
MEGNMNSPERGKWKEDLNNLEDPFDKLDTPLSFEVVRPSRETSEPGLESEALPEKKIELRPERLDTDSLIEKAKDTIATETVSTPLASSAPVAKPHSIDLPDNKEAKPRQAEVNLTVIVDRMQNVPLDKAPVAHVAKDLAPDLIKREA